MATKKTKHTPKKGPAPKNARPVAGKIQPAPEKPKRKPTKLEQAHAAKKAIESGKAGKKTVATVNGKAADARPVRVRQDQPPRDPIVEIIPPAQPGHYDVTRMDAFIYVTSSTGSTKLFKVVSQPTCSRFKPGERVAYVFRGQNVNDVRHWKGFATVDEFGVHVWRNYLGSATGERSSWERLAEVLENPSHFRKKGFNYSITVISLF